MSKKDFSFARGWAQVRQCDVAKVQSELMDALGVKTIQAFRNRRNGSVEPKVSEVKVIEGVFAKYGIKNVWGEA